MIESLISILSEAEAEARLDNLPFSLSRDHTESIMAELPNGSSLKFTTHVRGHCPSGPVGEDGRPVKGE